jgi:hypothetical protein
LSTAKWEVIGDYKKAGLAALVTNLFDEITNALYSSKWNLYQQDRLCEKST